VTVAYTDNDDLEVWVTDISALPDMTKYHNEAYSQIRRNLRTLGWTEEQLDDLTDETLEGLKAPSCHWVLYLLYQSQQDKSGEMMKRAEHHASEYRAALKATTIASNVETEPGADAPRRSGFTRLA
jgi:hypothetical protein